MRLGPRGHDRQITRQIGGPVQNPEPTWPNAATRWAARTAARSPQRAALAVATAVTGDEGDLTNSHWCFSRGALQAELGLGSLTVLNDFAALALSLPIRPRCGGCREP